MKDIPEELKYLIPKSCPIVIGSDVKELFPLPLDKWDKIISELEKVSGKVFTPELAASLEKPGDAVGVLVDKLLQVIKDNIGPVLAIALDMEESDVKGSITIPQITYAVKKIWEMNLKQPVIDIDAIIGSLIPKASNTRITQADIDEVLSKAEVQEKK